MDCCIAEDPYDFSCPLYSPWPPESLGRRPAISWHGEEDPFAALGRKGGYRDDAEGLSAGRPTDAQSPLQDLSRQRLF